MPLASGPSLARAYGEVPEPQSTVATPALHLPPAAKLPATISVATPGSVDLVGSSSHAEHTVAADRIFGQLLGILEDRTADVGSAPSPFTADHRVENVARARDDAIADLTDIRRRMRSARTPGGHTDPDLCADEIADASGEMIADLADGRRTDAEVSANADIGGG